MGLLDNRSSSLSTLVQDTRPLASPTSNTTPCLSSSTSVLTPKMSVTTSKLDHGPLDGGILLEEPYSTEAYGSPRRADDRFLSLTYRTSMPNMCVGGLGAGDFDTKKVAAHGTLKRRKMKSKPDLMDVDKSGEVMWDLDDGGEEGQDSPACKCLFGTYPTETS